MGFFTAGTARQAISGILTGGQTEPAVQSNVKLPIMKPSKTYKIPVPRDCKAGDQFRAELDGVDTILTVPEDFDHVKGSRIIHTVRGDNDLIISSTLPYVAGYEIVVSKQIVYACVMAPNMDIGTLIQQAQDQLTSQAIKRNCNAVLGVNFSVTTDGKDKTPVIFAFGTPCVVLQAASMPNVKSNGVSSAFLAPAAVAGKNATMAETKEAEVEDAAAALAQPKVEEDTAPILPEEEEEEEDDADMGIEM